jgi:V8-like Glu-specific endopeptidase
MQVRAIATLCVIPAGAFAQDDQDNARVNAALVSNEVVASTPAEEGALRFDARIEHPELYRPLVLPDAGPNVGQRRERSEAVFTYDVATGVETMTTLPDDPFRGQGWIAGRTLGDEVDEGMDSDFGTFSKQNGTTSPWSTQCRLFFNQGGGSYICSGTLIDAKYVITVGHCVHQGQGGTWSTNMVVAPRWDGDSNAFGLANGIALAASAGWKSSSNFNDDMGWIRLDRPVGFLTGWLGSFYDSDNNFWNSTTFHLAGFAGTQSSTFPDAPNALYYAFGSWTNVGTYQVTTKYPTSADFGGLSGAGVYYKSSAGNRYVGAAHSHSTDLVFWIDRTATRNTQGKFEFFHNTFKPAGYSSSKVDYVPLKVRTGNTTIARGTSFTSFTYKVGNSSLFNPASATVAVDVYLSKNDNISEADTRIQQHTFTNNFGVQTSVNVTAPPVTVPATTATGTWYTGVIVTSADNDASNNDTDGWDAQKIKVTL